MDQTHKLDLLAEISNLKLKLASSDKDKSEMVEKTEFALVSVQKIRQDNPVLTETFQQI